MPMRVQTRVSHHLRLHRALTELSLLNPAELTVAQLANSAGYSRFHLSRFCGKALSYKPAAFLRELRLGRSSVELLRTKKAISQISFEAGYAAPEVFTRAFRAKFGCSPTEFRARSTPLENLLQGLPVSAGIYPLEVVDRAQTRLAVLPYRGDYAQTHLAWERIQPYAPAEGEFYVVYHDNYATAKKKNLRADVGFAIGDEPAPRGLRTLTIPRGSYVVSEALDDLHYSAAWKQIGETWIPRSGSRPVNIPSFEVYDRWPLPYRDNQFRIFVGLELELGGQTSLGSQ
jgi:AraC-like DNA-binding protein/DNA gyrase inhibitor GyrI